MTDSHMPNNANDWADYLVEKPLPSPFKVNQRVIKGLGEEKLAYSKIATQINRDPILSFYILLFANKDRPQNAQGSKTLAHAISMIGVNELKSLITGHPRTKISSKNISSFYYIRTLCTSLYAAHLGRAISERNAKGKPEDIYWSSLFAGAPVWYLWHFATPEMRLIRYAIRSNYKLPQTAEREVLGDTMKDVTQALAQKLQLPGLAKDFYTPSKQLDWKQWITIARSFSPDGRPQRIEDRDISMKMQSPHFMVMIANLVAHYSSYCWYSRATLRSQRILAAYLQCPLDEAISLTHQAAADMSRAHPMPGLMLPAAKLFIPPRKRTKASPVSAEENIKSATNITAPATIISEKTTTTISEKGLSQAEVAASLTTPKTETPPETKASTEESTEDSRTHDTGLLSKKPAPIEPKSTNNPLYDELVGIMTHRPEEFVDLHELMNAATQGIAYGIELSRASVGLISKDGSRFKNYYSVGCQNAPELKDFESKIVKSTIFEKLSARPASIWVKGSSDRKILDLIPMNFKQAIDTKDFFLMSVFVAKKPVAIFYADNVDGKALTEKNYQQFKFLCGAVSTALQHQAKKK